MGVNSILRAKFHQNNIKSKKYLQKMQKHDRINKVVNATYNREILSRFCIWQEQNVAGKA